MFSALWNVAGMIAGGTRDAWNSTSSPSSADSSPSDTGQKTTRNWVQPDWPAEHHADAGFSEDSDASLPWMGTGTGNNRLFIQLLDDLDDITTNTPSAHRRRKAREMFSDWIFSTDMRGNAGDVQRGHQLRRSSAAEYGLRRPDLSAVQDERALRRSSGDFSSFELPLSKISPEHRATRCRSGDFSSFDVNCSPKVSPKVSPQHQVSVPGHVEKLQWLSSKLSRCPKENEDDSGYHTGGTVTCTQRAPGQQTLTREDCRRRIAFFNTNNHGLIMEPPDCDSNTFQGSIRVHMNLIRPINMCISLPPTIYDVYHTSELKKLQQDATNSVEMTSFRLPKDTSKVIHISSTTTTQEVIRILLMKFHITDSPRKFALYEKTQEMGESARMRRLCDDELPLQICLSWTDDGIGNLDCNQFVLQENDTGEILWEAFSLPELESFLSVLNREEEEYIEQMRMKYRLLKCHMAKRLREFKSTQSVGGK